MELSAFVIQIIFLVIPGIIARLIYRKLVGQGRLKEWEDFLEILLFSLVCYVIYGALRSIGGAYKPLEIFNAFFVDKNSSLNTLNWPEILGASGVALVLPFIVSFLQTKKVINKFGNWIGVTARYGDEDVWDNFNISCKDKWVVVRDHKYNLAYFGKVELCSDLTMPRELVLRCVTVAKNDTGKELYQVDKIYISRENYELSIELPRKEDLEKGKGESNE